VERERHRSIVLIGMPGAGKSTVGVILAKQTSRDFIDTDLLIQTAQQMSLQQILNDRGHMALRRIEEQILLSLGLRNHVVATGGSAAYSAAAMGHLKAHGLVVFLQVAFDVLLQRVKDFDTRGIARAPEQTFADLYRERLVLYEKYADVTIDCADLDQEQVAAKIRGQLASEPGWR
jgi:shikimate kinase